MDWNRKENFDFKNYFPSNCQTDHHSIAENYFFPLSNHCPPFARTRPVHCLVQYSITRAIQSLGLFTLAQISGQRPGWVRESQNGCEPCSTCFQRRAELVRPAFHCTSSLPRSIGPTVERRNSNCRQKFSVTNFTPLLSNPLFLSSASWTKTKEIPTILSL